MNKEKKAPRNRPKEPPNNLNDVLAWVSINDALRWRKQGMQGAFIVRLLGIPSQAKFTGRWARAVTNRFIFLLEQHDGH